VNIVVIYNVLFMSVFYFDSLASHCVCFLSSFFIYSALVANKGLISTHACHTPVIIGDNRPFTYLTEANESESDWRP